jgi:hypothetical protein
MASNGMTDPRRVEEFFLGNMRDSRGTDGRHALPGNRRQAGDRPKVSVGMAPED